MSNYYESGGVPQQRPHMRETWNTCDECGCSWFGYQRAVCEACSKDEEPTICPACSGSGEGQHDGTTCHSCKGRGTEGGSNAERNG